MSRASRLLELLQLLRRHRQPIGGAALAQALDVSLRTLYRDIATLQAQGAQIRGEPGVGYVLKPDFLLPPLMFTLDELEALGLGSRWVAARGDARLGEAARNALAKISAVLPTELRHELDSQALLVGPSDETVLPRAKSQVLPRPQAQSPTPSEPETDSDVANDSELLEQLRRAIRNERKLHIHYRDLKGGASERTIWPFALGFFDRVQLLVAWCELRQDLRSFRTDRISALTLSISRYPRRRQSLLREWRAREDIKPDA